MILETLAIDRDAFERRTGWQIKPEGACKGDRCVPLPTLDDQPLDAHMLAERLGMPLIQAVTGDDWCLGPEADGRTLTSVVAPDLVLPDIHGQAFHLRSLRGRKVLLVAWASW